MIDQTRNRCKKCNCSSLAGIEAAAPQFQCSLFLDIWSGRSIQFVSEFALEDARNAVTELQKCKTFLGEDPNTSLFFRNLVCMTVKVNQKKLYYNYCTSDKFLTLKFKFEVKCSDNRPPPPQLQMLRNVPEDQCNHHTTLNLAVVRVYEKANPQPLCWDHIDKFQSFFSANFFS